VLFFYGLPDLVVIGTIRFYHPTDLPGSKCMDTPLLVISNVPDMTVANTIAAAIVEQQAGACVNILPAVQSVYRWQGKVETAMEVTLLVKTVNSRYAALEQLIASLHPYDTPEIIAIPVAAGLPAYLQWIAQETTKDLHA
jgi:periplasmic divalent cation tolerance protein